MKTLLAFSLGLCLAMGMVPAQAQAIWKWKDKDGRVQVSDRPPPSSVPDSAILQRPGGPALQVVDHDQAPAAPPAGRPASAPQVDKALEARRARQQAEQAAQTKASEDAQRAQAQARKADNCQRARNQLAVLESGQRVARANAQGEREMLDDAGRAAEMRRLREAVNTHCSG